MGTVIRRTRSIVYPCATRPTDAAAPLAGRLPAPCPNEPVVFANQRIRLLGDTAADDPTATTAAASQAMLPLIATPFAEDAVAPVAPATPSPARGEAVTLRLSAAELQALVAATSDVVLVLDREGRYLRVGSSARNKLLGPPEALIGRRMEEVMPPLTARRFLDVVERALDTGEVQSLQYPLQIGGTTVWFDATVSPTVEDSVVWVARDVSARETAEAALRAHERDVRELFEAAFDGMLVCGPDLRCRDANTRLCNLLGRTRGELLSVDYPSLIEPNDLAQLPLRLEELYAARRLVTERRLLRGDGSAIDVEVGTSLLDDGRILFVIRDATERKKAEETIRALALLDELTGLYNRRGFIALAEREWERSRAERRGALLAVFDLDDLKPINDTHGHAEGDAALTAVASVLRATFRGSDVVGRLGGDEFVAFVVPGGPGVAGMPAETDARLALTARLVRDRFARHLADHNAQAAAAGRPYELRVSIGLAQEADEDSKHVARASSLTTLLAEADARLYEEKRGRKSRRT